MERVRLFEKHILGDICPFLLVDRSEVTLHSRKIINLFINNMLDQRFSTWVPPIPFWVPFKC